MPSNPDLIQSIGEVAKENGVEVPETEGKTNVELAAILKELKTPELSPEEKAEAAAKAKAKGDEAKAAAKTKALAEARAKAEAAIPPYRIAKGKAVTSRKGILADGEEIKAEYLAGGKETLDTLVDRGVVIKK